jgi:hypothetical protein
MRDACCVLRAAYFKRHYCGTGRRTAFLHPQHRQRDLLEEVAQAEASPVRAGDGRTGQDKEHDKDDHPAAAASAGTAPSEAKALLQPIEGGSQQKELEKSFQTALTVSHDSPFQKLCVPTV